jgi:hypothetical protein
MTVRGVLQTGQRSCFNEQGLEVDCAGSGQDGEYCRGLEWPEQRFKTDGETVNDRLTGLTWPVNANLAGFPLAWQEALDFAAAMNGRAEFGCTDWRLPNRRELRSLISYRARRPALPDDHPFANVVLNWYWTSTTAAINPAYAWYLHMDGARMFYGGKNQFYLVWPVRGVSGVLPATGQDGCFDALGGRISCTDQVQDGGSLSGTAWPEERFVVEGSVVRDRLTGLQWLRRASLSRDEVSWAEALKLVVEMNGQGKEAGRSWRLPNINELESLVDSSTHSPALPKGHPFEQVRQVYWSSTTSCYEPDWAWALYLTKGALGVGIKRDRNFHVWPVKDG